MRRIQKQFGSKFAEMLAACPTLVKDLAELRRRRIKIWRTAGKDVYSKRGLKLIRIGRNYTLMDQVLFLAHEAQHILRGRTPEPCKAGARAQYIQRSLNEEVNCILHEIKVLDELKAAGYDITNTDLTFYRKFKRGGRLAVRRALTRTEVAGERIYYPEFYGRQYDKSNCA